MPLGSPLPPPLPLPLPPPPWPSRLSWPGPWCRPRTIMPSTAAGGGRGAAAARGGPAGQGTQEALGGAGRGCGVRPPASGRACRNHELGTANSQYALLVAEPPGKSLLPDCRRRLPGHGPARPGRWSRRAGGEAGSCLSFLPFFEIKIPSSGRSARGSPGGLCCQSPRLGGARGIQEPGPRPAALPRDGGRGWRLGSLPPGRISCLRLSGSGPAAAGPRVWLVLARRRRVSRAGAARIAHRGRPLVVCTPPARHARRPFPPRDSQCAARCPGGTPSGPTRPAARSRLSARVHARRLLTSGPQRLSSPGTPGPAHRTS